MKKNRHKKESLLNKRVLVKWIDAISASSGWIDLNDFETSLSHVKTYGVVVFEDKDVLGIAGSYAEEQEYSPRQANGIITVPKACIREIIFLSYNSESYILVSDELVLKSRLKKNMNGYE